MTFQLCKLRELYPLPAGKLMLSLGFRQLVLYSKCQYKFPFSICLVLHSAFHILLMSDHIPHFLLFGPTFCLLQPLNVRPYLPFSSIWSYILPSTTSQCQSISLIFFYLVLHSANNVRPYSSNCKIWPYIYNYF